MTDSHGGGDTRAADATGPRRQDHDCGCCLWLRAGGVVFGGAFAGAAVAESLFGDPAAFEGAGVGAVLGAAVLWRSIKAERRPVPRVGPETTKSGEEHGD